MTHRTLFPPPDENRALEQLERFHREILRARRDRERAGAEFEGFVQDFRPPQEGTSSSGEHTSRRATRPLASPERAVATDQTTRSSENAAVRSGEESRPLSPRKTPKEVESSQPIPARAASSSGARRGFLLGIAVLLLVGAASAFYLWQRSQTMPVAQPTAGPVTRAPAPVPAPQARQPPAASARPPESAPAAAPVSPSTVQLITNRAVWMRVIVDGQKILEREVAAGQQLTYTPTATIVVRAGDAGGVRIKIGNGAEQVLGRDAFPVTRRFEVPSTSAR